MRHRFPTIDIPKGEGRVDVACIFCGFISRIYSNGKRTYFNDNGDITNNPTKQCAGRVLLKTNGLNQTEASLKDAITMIRLMYEDMIKANVNTTSRHMAGRFLYSKGYTEIVSGLTKKCI